MDFGNAPGQGTIALIIVTAILTSLFTAFGKRFGESLIEFVLKPCRLIYDLVYRRIAPRNPFSISLRSYRRHVLRSDLTRMENPVGPAVNVPIERAFAPLKLKSGSGETIDLFAFAATTRRGIVLGGPGTGKTTLMKNLLTSIIRKRCHNELDELIPVFVALRALAKKQQTVTEAIVSSLADYHFPGAAGFVESSLNTGMMLIILDGLDEVGANRSFVVEQVLQFCRYDAQRPRQNRVLVTCREHSYRAMDLREQISTILQVEPFANHHMRVFLLGWPVHKDRSAISLYSILQDDPQIRDICRNPLLLTILTGLFLDTDNFELPSSRERFYRSVIDELLLQRPARRQIIQQFHADEKRQILERVALDRLETVARDEDPEEFTQDALRNKATQVLRTDTFDFRELVRELVEINGIIKPAGEESGYTCAHRTIQEYLAAREALRSRQVSTVIEAYGKRSELIEVLYFYCGIQRNVPVLHSILERLTEQGQWLEAGRSLVYMEKAPGESVIEKVASELYLSAIQGTEIKQPLELLSSLANRRDADFNAARRLFYSAIDTLAASNDSGASALESSISSSPEIALKLIPGLLKHQSERWRATGVQLLRDIGTDEALDKLIQLLLDEDPYLRRRAALVLCGMIRNRNSDLRQRETFLPARKDKIIWPLESYFPGTIAIPIAEALDPGEKSGSLAIDSAVMAINMRYRQGAGGTLRPWIRVPLDALLDKGRQTLAFHVGASFLSLAIGLPVLLIALHAWLYTMDRSIALTLSPPYITDFDRRPMDAVASNARKLTKEIESSYPGPDLGWRRILPWSWFSDPNIPTRKLEALKAVEKWNFGVRGPLEAIEQANALDHLTDLVSPNTIRDLRGAIHQLRPFANSRYYFVISSNNVFPSIVFFSVFTLLPMATIFNLFKRRSIYERDSKGAKSTLSLTRVVNFTIGRNWDLDEPYLFRYLHIVVLVVPSMMMMTMIEATEGIHLTLICSILTLGILGIIIDHLRWPNNPLLATLAELSGSTHV